MRNTLANSQLSRHVLSIFGINTHIATFILAYPYIWHTPSKQTSNCVPRLFKKFNLILILT